MAVAARRRDRHRNRRPGRAGVDRREAAAPSARKVRGLVALLLGVAGLLFGTSAWLRATAPGDPLSASAPAPVAGSDGGVRGPDAGHGVRTGGPAPLPPGLRELAAIPWGGGLRLNGQAVSLTLHAVAEPPWVVSEAYARRFDGRSAPTRRQGFSGGEYLATLRPDGGLDSVLVFRRPEGGSWVVPGVSFGAVRPGAEAQALTPLLPFSHQVLSSHTARDAGLASVTAVASADGPPDRLLAGLEGHLSRLGWQPVPLPGPGRGAPPVRVFRRGAAELQVAGAEGAPGTSLLFLVHTAPEGS